MDLRAALLAVLLPVTAHAQIVLDRFGGQNDTDSPASLAPWESPDMLNVESNLTGTALLKRKGFSREGALTVSTAAVTGSHTFKDTSGNTLVLVFHDRYASKSTNGGAFSNWLTTAPANITRWQCVDVGGKAYCVNDQRIAPLEYDGTTQRPPASMPSGAVIELCGDRMAIADVSATPNRVSYSQSGVYTNFTTGTDSADPWTDDFGTPGDRVTGLKCDRGRLHIFKTASIISCILGDQYTTKCFPVSNAVGTLDPLSIVGAPDGIYFKSQVGTFWRLNDDGLTLVSQKIGTLVKSQPSGSGQSNTQTTQTDWNGGRQFPTGSWSTAAVAGAVVNSSATLDDSTVAMFNLGSSVGAGVNPRGNVEFAGVTSTYVFRYDANALPDSDGWTNSLTGSPSPSVSGGSLTVRTDSADGGYYKRETLASNVAKFLVFRMATRRSGSDLCAFGFGTSGGVFNSANIQVDNSNVYYRINSATVLTEAVTQPTYSTFTVIVTSGNVAHFWRDGVFKVSGSAANLHTNASHAIIFPGSPLSGNSYIWLDFIHYSTGVPNPGDVNIPDVSTFTSRIFDTTFSTTIAGPLTSTVTIPSNTSITYEVRSSTSPNNDMWGSYVAVAPPGRATFTKRFIQYKLAIAHSGLTESPGATGVSLVAATTGQYRTQAIETGSNVGSWGLLSCDTTITGNASLVFYATGAYSAAALSTMTPVEWPVQTNNSALGISVNVSSAVYIGWRSLLTSATDQAQVNACTLYWNNGTLPQPSWGVYDPIKNAAYWSLTSGNSTSNNRVLKYDLNLDAWYPFGLNATALLFNNSQVYFGGSAGATWNKYGLVDSDNGGAINAYWKSKDFASASPFQETQWQAVSIVARNQTTGNLTGTYNLSTGQSGTYSVSIGTTSTRTYVRSSYLLPLSSPANFINTQFGNNSTTPFEVLGLRIDGTPTPWRVTNP